VANFSENRKTLPPFAALRAFEAVGRLSGIRRAAQTLGLDHAVISRHLRALEDWAGTRLVDRTQGNTVLTPEGLRYHARVTAALAELSDASNELIGRNSDRCLSICCVPGFATAWLASRLEFFQSAHPELELELHPTDQSPDFMRYEADVDIRYVSGPQPVTAATTSSGVRRFEMARPPVWPVASPECVATLTSVSQPSDLLKAPLLHEESHNQWRYWLSVHGVSVPEQLPGPRLWHAHLTVEAARRGQGVALANPFLLGDDLKTGRLVDPLAGNSKSVALGAYVFTARADRWQAPAVVRFRHWLKKAVAEIDAACATSETSEASRVAPV
jgi:LysR family glycine cleavage system transcriptional activator